MTKKDYIAIAKVISALHNHYRGQVEVCHSKDRQFNEGTLNGINKLADRLIDIMANDNPDFDRERFMIACSYVEAQQ